EEVELVLDSPESGPGSRCTYLVIATFFVSGDVGTGKPYRMSFLRRTVSFGRDEIANVMKVLRDACGKQGGERVFAASIVEWGTDEMNINSDNRATFEQVFTLLRGIAAESPKCLEGRI